MGNSHLSSKTPQLKSLSKKEISYLIDMLETTYNCSLNYLREKYFYETQKHKVYMSCFSIDDVPLDRINSLGIYFGTFHSYNRFRPSLEGSQYISPQKNYVIISDLSLASFLSAENVFEEDISQKVEVDTEFILVRHKSHTLGSISKKQDYYLNYLSKSRKLDFNKVF